MQSNVSFTSARKFDSLYEMMAPMSSTNYLNSVLRLKYTIILKWSFLNFKIVFYNNDDSILFHFNMEKLNMFNFLHIKTVKISFEIIRHHCFVVATTRNLHGCVYFYVNIRLNKNKSCTTKLVDRFWILEEIKNLKGKKVFNQTAAKLKMLNSQKLLLKLFTTQSNI